MLTRLDILKLEFIYRVIDRYNKKLFLNLYQIDSITLEDDYMIDQEDNWLTYPAFNYDYMINKLKAYYQTVDTNYNISEKKELTSKDIDYLFEQADFQMRQK